jgi:hypothetical protein
VLMLRGSYVDVSPNVSDKLRPGSMRWRSASHRHTVQVGPKGSLTLLMTGRSSRRWGFWVNGKLIKRDKYFAVYGHHPCDNGIPIRIRPDRSRI